MLKCKDCSFYTSSKNPSLPGMVCDNPKLSENTGQSGNDNLTYPYSEGAMFQPGADFGCIHHSLSDAEEIKPWCTSEEGAVMSMPFGMEENKEYLLFVDDRKVNIDDLMSAVGSVVKRHNSFINVIRVRS